MERRLFNFVQGQLGAAMGDQDETITFESPPNLPTLEEGEYVPLVIDPDHAPEIVYLVEHQAGTTAGVIERGREGTFAGVHDAGSWWRHSPLVADLEGVGGGGGYSPADVAEDEHPDDDDFTDESLDPSWILTNPGADFAVEPTRFGLRMSLGPDDTRVRAIMKQCPPGDFRIMTAFHDILPWGDTISGVQMAVAEGGDGEEDAQAQNIGIYSSSEYGGEWTAMTQPYNDFNDRVTNVQLGPWFGYAVYLRMDVYDDGGQWRIDSYYSALGTHWQKRDEGRALDFIPNRMGVGLYGRGGDGIDAICRWFRVEDL